MPRDWRLQVDDILNAIRNISNFVQDLDYEAFLADLRTQHAVINNLVIIGESARALPAEVRDTREEIEWRKIIGLRNILVHHYFAINSAIVWDVAQNKLEDLHVCCEELLRDSQV